MTTKQVLERAGAIQSAISLAAPDSCAGELAFATAECASLLIENGAFAEAVDFTNSFIAASRHLNLTGGILRVRVARIRALLNASRVVEAEEEVRYCLERASVELPNDIVPWGMLRAYEGACLWKRNDAGEAIRKLEALQHELRQFPDSIASCVCSLELRHAYLLAGDRRRARHAALEAWIAARRCGAEHWLAYAGMRLADVERLRCRWSAATEAIDEALAGFERTGNGYFFQQCLHQKAIIDWKRGDNGAALATSDGVLAQSRATRTESLYWVSSLLRAVVLVHLGRFSEASMQLTEDPEWQVPRKSSRNSLLTAEYLGDIDLEQGNAAPALARYEAALAQALVLVPRGDIVAELRRRIAECRLLLGEPQRALDEAKEALAHCHEIHERYDEAATHRVIALAHAALGQNDEARRAFDRGFADFDEIETPYEWGKLWLSLADWLASEGAGTYRNDSAAVEAYQSAVGHFERMGAAFRLDQARSRLEALQARMATEGAAYEPTGGKIKPQRRPRHGAELLRKAQWALETFGLVTRSAPLLRMLEEVAAVAPSDLPVLVLGESGTGKELVARGLHTLSGRTGEFLAINCSAVPEAMLEGEFFGYMRGAFTNAVADKPGLFEVADTGSVFLDEIGEMSPDLQAKLLRFLETGTLRRVGATRDTNVSTRIVAATNRERAKLQGGEGFRADLYYRLAHVVFELPPLRSRGDDVELLVDHFLAGFNAQEAKRTRLSPPARERLIRHSWPGNVRELRSVLHRMVVTAPVDGVLTPRDLPPLLQASAPATFEDETDASERRRIIAALEQASFVKTDAAAILRISRTTLIGKMRRLGIEG